MRLTAVQLSGYMESGKGLERQVDRLPEASATVGLQMWTSKPDTTPINYTDSRDKTPLNFSHHQSDGQKLA